MFRSADNLNLKPTVEYDNPNYLLNKERILFYCMKNIVVTL